MDARAVPRFRERSLRFFVDTRFGVIHEDEDLLVLEKPAPLAVHPVGSYGELNLHSLVRKDPRWADTNVHFAHRLDSETSGVILAAKTHEAARSCGIEFMKGRARKLYHALVFGRPSLPEGTIAVPLGSDKSSGFQTVRVPDLDKGERAATRYRVLRTDGAYSLLEVSPFTGRTHQIRAHLSFIGNPIVGDKIYIDISLFQRYVLGGIDDEMLGRLKLRRLALHSSELTIRHPRTRRIVTFRSPAPDFYSEMAA